MKVDLNIPIPKKLQKTEKPTEGKSAKKLVKKKKAPIQKNKQDVLQLSEKSKELAKKIEAQKSKIKENENQIKSDRKKIKKLSEVKLDKLQQTLHRPAIFFVGGLDLWPVTNYDGVKEMSDQLKGAKYFGHLEKDAIIDQVKRTAKNQPVVLVGHSYGGDTIVEVANELNQLKNGFRKVDLLVTLDSVGSDNDIIPQNVVKNVNFFGEDGILRDGPNAPRNPYLTKVINEIRPEDHTDLDDSKNIHFKIFTEIQNTLKHYESQRSSGKKQ